MHLSATTVIETERGYLFGNNANLIEFNHCHSLEKHA
jgi:hypothetical protein